MPFFFYANPFIQSFHGQQSIYLVKILCFANFLAKGCSKPRLNQTSSVLKCGNRVLLLNSWGAYYT